MTEHTLLFQQLLQANKSHRDKKYQEAIALYLQILTHLGEDPEILAMVGYCYYMLASSNPNETGENYQKAVIWLKRAVILAPNNGRLHAVLAQYYELGMLDYEQAAQEYRKAIELSSCDVWALISAAGLYGVPEEVVTLNEAITWLERAVEIEPDNPYYHFRLGSLYREADRLVEADQEWRKALLCPQPLDPGPAYTIESVLDTS